MGAIKFNESIIGTSAEKGYKELCDKADKDYGHQEGYSGAINSTDGLGRCYFKGDFNKTNEKNAQKIINERLPKMHTNDCGYIVLEGVEWEVITVNKKNKDSNPQYKVKFNVYNDRTGFLDSSPLASEDTITKAWDKAINHTLTTGEKCFVRKEQTLVKGSSLVGEVEVVRKRYKSKPKSKFKSNQKLIQYNKYIYFGSAAY